jgi:hypothetical protein
MQQKRTGKRLLRGSIAAFFGLLILAATLPSTGGIIEGPERHGMSRFGPFLFYPGAFFSVVGVVMLASGCTLFGIVRGNACEIVGWVLLGVLSSCVLMG